MDIRKILQKGLSKAFAIGKAAENDSHVDLKKIDIVHILKGVGTLALSTLFGCAPTVFSCYPLGVAFLCAADKLVPYSYVGLLISSLFTRPYSLPSAVVYTVILMLRFAVCRLLDAPTQKSTVKLWEKLFTVGNAPLFGEGVPIRCAISAFAALIFGLYRLIAGGFLYYDLFGLLAAFFICPLLTLALSCMYTSDERLSRFSEISFAAVMFMTVLSLRPYTLFGFSPAFAAALFVTLWAATQAGALKGCAVGLFAGLACGGTSVTDAFGALQIAYSLGAAPCIMASAGLVTGILWKFSRIGALISASVIGMSLGLTVDGYAILPRLLPDIVCTAAIFLPLSHFGVLPPIPIFANSNAQKIGENIVILEKKQTDTASRMNTLSEAFSHLSDTLYALSDRMKRPGVVDLKQVCDGVFEKYCAKCSMAAHCLEKEYMTTLDAQGKVTAALYKNGRIEPSDVPPYLRERCFNITVIADEINRKTAKLIEKLYKNDKTESFALDYEAMSKLLSEQISKNDGEYQADEQMSATLRRSLKYMNIPSRHVICYGTRKKQIFIGGVDVARMRMGAREIREAVENTVGVRLSTPRFNIEGDTVTMTLCSRPKFSVTHAKATSIKDSEKANGDNAVCFEGREDYSYALICDGMGSGREAAFTSGLCTMFLERMLSGGNGKAVTLQMLNGFMRTRNAECSATVDLAEVDLITGEACFVKSGAAPSFILRNGNLYKIQSKTVPIGIMRELDAEKVKFELVAGDVIVMVSDGVAQSLEDGIWLANLLTYEWDDDLDAMAQKVLDNAVFANKRSDDMTVILTRIDEAKAQ